MSNVMQLLGLARRAGAVRHGTEAVRRSIREGEARLVLLARDASPAQLDKIRQTLTRRRTATSDAADRATLGAALGLAPVSAVAVTSAPLADRIAAELATGAPTGGEIEVAWAAAEE